jgi:hypothetical protein
MSDLIERLRDAAIYGPIPCPICDEAADRLAEAETLLRWWQCGATPDEETTEWLRTADGP